MRSSPLACTVDKRWLARSLLQGFSKIMRTLSLFTIAILEALSAPGPLDLPETHLPSQSIRHIEDLAISTLPRGFLCGKQVSSNDCAKDD